MSAFNSSIFNPPIEILEKILEKSLINRRDFERLSLVCRNWAIIIRTKPKEIISTVCRITFMHDDHAGPWIVKYDGYYVTDIDNNYNTEFKWRGNIWTNRFSEDVYIHVYNTIERPNQTYKRPVRIIKNGHKHNYIEKINAKYLNTLDFEEIWQSTIKKHYEFDVTSMCRQHKKNSDCSCEKNYYDHLLYEDDYDEGDGVYTFYEKNIPNSFGYP